MFDPLARLGIDVLRLRLHWRWIRWRSLLLIATVALGLLGFIAGVGTSERPEIVHAGPLAKLYYTFGLFLFGGMDLGTPQGGPPFARVALWMAYFAAPAITASAVIEAVVRVLGAESWLLRRLKGHIVVAGCGRLTQLYLARLREAEPELTVVVVGSVEESHTFEELREVYRAQVVEGDITSDGVLRRLRLEHAARVLLLTEDDFINLDASARILHLAPNLANHVIAHVGDLRFMRSMSATSLARRCQVFNSHQIGACHLVDVHLLEYFESTEPRDMVVLAGFGRFGQSVLDALQRSADGAFDHIVLVDLECTQRAAIFAEQVGFSPNYHREVVDGDLRDPEVWARVEARLDISHVAPVFIVGTGDDRTDLRMAMRLASRYPHALVIARSDRQWSFAEDLAHESLIHVFSVARLVAESMPAQWFGPRTEHPVPLEPKGARSPASSMLAPRVASPGHARVVHDVAE